MLNQDGVPGFGPSCGKWGFPTGSIKANTDEEIQKIYSSLECPVCHQFPKGTIYSCKQNRHIICKACLPESRICPGCQDVISESESIPAETCMANFIIPCKFKLHGCVEMIRGENIRNHLDNCTYRPMPCIMAKCTESVPFKQLWKHLLDAHGPKVNGITDCNKHVVEWWIDGDAHSTARWPPFYFTAFDNVFLYMCASTKHGTWEWMWILANGEEASRFRVETRMINMENGMGVQWRGPVHPVRKHVRDIIASGQVFVTNSKEIRNPFLFKKGNDGRSFWRTEVVIHQISPPLPTSIPYLITNDPNKHFLSKPKDSWAYEVDKLVVVGSPNAGLTPINATIVLPAEANPTPVSQMYAEDLTKNVQEELNTLSGESTEPNPEVGTVPPPPPPPVEELPSEKVTSYTPPPPPPANEPPPSEPSSVVETVKPQLENEPPPPEPSSKIESSIKPQLELEKEKVIPKPETDIIEPPSEVPTQEEELATPKKDSDPEDTRKKSEPEPELEPLEGEEDEKEENDILPPRVSSSSGLKLYSERISKNDGPEELPPDEDLQRRESVVQFTDKPSLIPDDGVTVPSQVTEPPVADEGSPDAQPPNSSLQQDEEKPKNDSSQQ